MVEIEVFDILKQSYKTWKSNLNICIPFIISTSLIIIFSTILFATVFLQIFLPMLNTLSSNPVDFFSTQDMTQTFSAFIDSIPQLIISVILFIIFVAVVSSFFTAGAIGMAKEILLNGKAEIDHMWKYGRRKWFSLLCTNFMVAGIALVGFLFLVPGLFWLFSTIGSDQNASSIFGGVIIFALGTLLTIIYIAIISIAFALVQYAVILDDLKSVEGVKKGFHVFWQYNKINVFALWVLLILAGALLSVFQFIPYIGSFVYMVLTLVVLAPFSTICWSKLYLEITK